MVDHAAVAARALEWANTHHPESSVQHRAAFANGVALLVTEESGGYGGPSIREHMIARQMTERLSFEEAIALAAPIAFGPLDLNTARAIAATEHCFDDDPIDLSTLKVPPSVAAIIAAWQRGEHGRAVTLTKLWEARQGDQFCAVCGKRLSKSNRSGHCLEHRDRGPRRAKKKTQ